MRHSPSPLPLITRRAALRVGAVAGAAVVVGCTDDADPGPTPSPTPSPDPDITWLAEAAAAERTLIARYAGPVRVSATGRSLLRALRAHHEAHLADLEAAIVALGGPTPATSASGTPSGGPSPTGSSGTAPGAPFGAVLTPAQLRTQEQRTGRDATDLVGRAADGDVALLLAEVGASHAQHVVALGGVT